MGFLAALFLTYMPFEQAFYTFFSVLKLEPSPLRELYLPKLIEIQKILFVFDLLAHQHLPRLWAHLTAEGLHPTMFFTEWAMTLFVRGFDFDLVTRVWDIFLLERQFKLIYRVSLAILKVNETALLERRFDKIMAMVRDLPSYCDVEQVMAACWAIPLKRAHIEEAEKMVSAASCFMLLLC